MTIFSSGLSTIEKIVINSSKLCDELQPCFNGGICRDNGNDIRGYSCDCSDDYKGIYCEKDHRICQWKTCSNNGKNQFIIQMS